MVNTNANTNYIFSAGQSGQGIINDSIKLGYLPLNYSFLSVNTFNINELSLFPNPFNDEIIILYPDWNQISHMTIYAVNGSIIYTEKIKESNTHLKSINLDFVSKECIIFHSTVAGKCSQKK